MIDKIPNFKIFATSSAVSLTIVILGFMVQPMLPPQIPLFYGYPAGADQLAGKIYIVIPSLLALTLTLVNAFFAFFVKNIFLQKVLAGISLVAAFLAAITAGKIFFLIGNF